ncbi:hypothetical protein PV08_02474 [Exophiala spinifera]|uniref:Uncharacterized protein n=1 Tax=Exophiala spinifera TaxID=91928 RepID=A0A0D1YSF7_9EURO|nr:uncharacterized protein PV08_02474 [Exophiala spinifera]KIW18186.1 hypothetical protein PV08_02474 [Exophiala spinifera]
MTNFTAINTARSRTFSANAHIRSGTRLGTRGWSNRRTTGFDPKWEPYVRDCLSRVQQYYDGEEDAQVDVDRAVAICALVDMRNSTQNNDDVEMADAESRQSSSSSAATQFASSNRASLPATSVTSQLITPSTTTPIVTPTITPTITPTDLPTRPSSPKPETSRRAKRGKRSRYNDNDDNKNRSPSDHFAHRFKMVMNTRSSKNDDHEKFSDAQLHGLGSVLLPAEIELYKSLNISESVYRCQRARFFLGIAAFTEELRRRKEKGLLAKSPWNIGRSQFQMFGNMDANKSSRVFDFYLEHGWVQHPKQTAESLHTYETIFSQEHRNALHAEMRNWGAKNGKDDDVVTV